MTEEEREMLRGLPDWNREELEMEVDGILNDYGGADDPEELEYHARECLRDSFDAPPEWRALLAAELRRRAQELRSKHAA